jgi:hypothetical protein
MKVGEVELPAGTPFAIPDQETEAKLKALLNEK